MSHIFEVTGLGLQIDKVHILPGSQLTLSGPAPSHWSRFGNPGNGAPKQLEVATPEAASAKAGSTGSGTPATKTATKATAATTNAPKKGDAK